VAENKKIQNDYDVLIIGAGPTGLALGLQLARYGVRFQIIDQKSTFSEHSQAYALQASILEVLNDLGVMDGFSQLGVPVRKVNAYINGTASFDINFRQDIPGPYPFQLSLDQAKTERILAGALQQQGHQISWNANLLSFKETKTGITAEIAQDGKKVSTTASWIVGCDGRNSTVRNILGVPLQGNTYTEKFIVADLAIEWQLLKSEGHAFLHPSDLFIVMPLPNGLCRVITTQDGIKHKGEITVKDLVQKFQKLVPILGSLTKPTWLSAFEVQRRYATHMKAGRAFLAGDAAHVMSPIGGQGLNAGIQDAYNLGWKLGYHINGLVGDKFLNSYEDERLDVAKTIHAHTNLAMNIVMTHSKIGQVIRDIVAPLILNYPAAQKQLKRIIADTPHNYSKSQVLHQEKESGQVLARKVKESFLRGVTVGQHAPSFDLMQPKDYKRFQLLKLLQTPKHVVLIMLGEKSREFRAYHDIFNGIKNKIKGFAESYFIIGEHAIDYTTFDPEATDTFVDPDGRGHMIYNCVQPTLFLIRPDGYVSYKGPPDEAKLMAYVGEYFDVDKASEIANKIRTDTVSVAVNGD
jgi:2-polyprenyl-6-methoxyphenol hydroxylase-like FAD-dependent oxidoreductase